MSQFHPTTIIFLIVFYLIGIQSYYQSRTEINQRDLEHDLKRFDRAHSKSDGKKIPFVAKRANVPYNTVLGVASSNVPAYSNGDDSYFSGKSNFLYGVYMGIKWQCVEYARRWLFVRKGCIFSNIDSANDMWFDLNYIERVVDGKRYRLIKHANGSPEPPKLDSILIYQKNSILPFGHVAIIVDVGTEYIRVAEQNYYFHYWSRPYAREIPVQNRNGRYYIQDRYTTYGWMEIEGNSRLSPLNSKTIDVIMNHQHTAD